MTGWMGLDIGPEAIKQFEEALKDAKVCDGAAWKWVGTFGSRGESRRGESVTVNVSGGGVREQR